MVDINDASEEELRAALKARVRSATGQYITVAKDIHVLKDAEFATAVARSFFVTGGPIIGEDEHDVQKYTDYLADAIGKAIIVLKKGTRLARKLDMDGWVVVRGEHRGYTPHKDVVAMVIKEGNS